MTTFYRRNLPHIHPSQASFFVTFRLAGPLPLEVIERLREESRAEEQRLKSKFSGAVLLVVVYGKDHLARHERVMAG